MLIFIDGIDCVGKTTISNSLALEFNANIINSGKGKIIKELVNGTKNIDCKFLYYLANYINEILIVNIQESEIIIFDRSIISTFAYHISFGAKLSIENIFSVIPTPEIKIFLTCNKQAWLNRIASKKNIDWYEQALIDNPYLANNIENEYRKFSCLEICSDDLSKATDEIKLLIKDKLKK